MKKTDFIIIAVALAAALAVFLFFRGGKEAAPAEVQVYLNGALYKSFPLSENTIKIESENGYNIIKTDGGGARIIEADCENGDCVKSGKITSSAQIIACLPHRLVVRLSGAGETGADVIAS